MNLFVQSQVVRSNFQGVVSYFKVYNFFPHSISWQKQTRISRFVKHLQKSLLICLKPFWTEFWAGLNRSIFHTTGENFYCEIMKCSNFWGKQNKKTNKQVWVDFWSKRFRLENISVFKEVLYTDGIVIFLFGNLLRIWKKKQMGYLFGLFKVAIFKINFISD